MKEKNMLDPTLRLSTTRGGAIAVSGNLYSTARKARNVTEKVTSRPMTLGEDHEYFVPPHSSARMRQTRLGTRQSRPRGSRRLSVSRSVGDLRCCWWGGGGRCKKKKMHNSVKAPMGRLM